MESVVAMAANRRAVCNGVFWSLLDKPAALPLLLLINAMFMANGHKHVANTWQMAYLINSQNVSIPLRIRLFLGEEVHIPRRKV